MAVRGKHGALLAGRYRLLEQLGEGGMGSVWKAEHQVLHSHVAIKIIDPEVARLEFNLARFLREAKTLASLRSPHVVQVLDFGSDADTPYLVMELLQGQTLGRRLSDQGRLSLGEISRVMGDVCSAMALVHEQGLIHRDLKPENIFLCGVGEQQVTKIVDFGIAKSLRGDMSASMKTRTGHMLGTPSYMSPEQCRGLKDIDHRADLWALGVIVYECLLGKVPFEGEVLGDLLLRICMDPLPIPSQQFQGVLNGSFDAWFARAVARDRTQRFQSAHELALALSELADSETPDSESPPPSQPSHSRPSASQPSHSRPSHARPSHSRPSASQPSHSRPSHARPSHSQPSPSQPSTAFGLSETLATTPREAALREAARSAPGATPAPSSSPVHRPPTNTETNTTVGLVDPARRADRLARGLAIGAALLALGFGWWAFDTQRSIEPPVNVEVQSLRPPYEVTPKVIRPSVQTGRRWTPSLSPAPSGPSEELPSKALPPEALPSEALSSDALSGSIAPSPAGPGAPSGAAAGAGGPPKGEAPSDVAEQPAAPLPASPAPLRGTSAPGTPVRHHPVTTGGNDLRQLR